MTVERCQHYFYERTTHTKQKYDGYSENHESSSYEFQDLPSNCWIGANELSTFKKENYQSPVLEGEIFPTISEIDHTIGRESPKIPHVSRKVLIYSNNPRHQGRNLMFLGMPIECPYLEDEIPHKRNAEDQVETPESTCAFTLDVEIESRFVLDPTIRVITEITSAAKQFRLIALRNRIQPIPPEKGTMRKPSWSAIALH
ncbi:hypothetical protein J6590_049659 [Homalodisca vitripennis]|nr:hypothetical protein J6590_049659 [Homalodisca vitripennis]